jgi:hypothetical protein
LLQNLLNEGFSNVTRPLDDVLRRTAAATAAYQVPERTIELAASALLGVPDGPRLRLEVRALRDAALLVAEAHRRDCAESVCTTCEAIRYTLAVALATVRSETHPGLDERPG